MNGSERYAQYTCEAEGFKGNNGLHMRECYWDLPISKVSVHVDGHCVTGCMHCVFYVWKASDVKEVIWYALSFLEQNWLYVMNIIWRGSGKGMLMVTRSVFFLVHYLVTIRTKSIILGIHLLLDHVISVPDPHLALTYITWSGDFVLYLWLYLDKHHTLYTCSVSHCKWPHIFIGHCDLYFK